VLDTFKFLLLMMGIVGLPLGWVIGIQSYKNAVLQIFDGMAQLKASELQRVGWPQEDDLQNTFMRPPYDQLIASLHHKNHNKSAVLGKVWIWGLPECIGISDQTRRAARRYRSIKSTTVLLFFGVLPYFFANSFVPSLLILTLVILFPIEKFFSWPKPEGEAA